MQFQPFDQLVEAMDSKSKAKEPFCFFIDYEQKASFLGSQEDAHRLGIFFDFTGNFTPLKTSYHFSKEPVSFDSYLTKFEKVQSALKAGNSFLLNLTQETKIQTNLTLKEIFESADAKYKLLFEDKFVVFSPETFIKIIGDTILSYPMKGTQKDEGEDPKTELMNNAKENAEHATIVDLIRNDLSKVAHPVRVESYKYLEKVKTHDGDLWQMSSVISGEIKSSLKGKIGSILREILPAGSITGAPKESTCQIIKDTEGYERGFYTGIMGIFDGKNLDSAVMIRFIENKNGQLFFKSGGGITVFSEVEKEYAELNDKIYLPF